MCLIFFFQAEGGIRGLVRFRGVGELYKGQEKETVELINICPKTMAELRSFTFGWKKLILSETLEKILQIIKVNS